MFNISLNSKLISFNKSRKDLKTSYSLPVLDTSQKRPAKSIKKNNKL